MRSLASVDWLVIAAGATSIALVVWYFFFAERATAVAAASATGGPQETTILVRGGYSPAIVRARAGVPLRLIFDRQETSSCSEEIVFPAFGLRRFLPANEQTTVEITPPSPGTYDFTCGMSMLYGKVVAE